MPRLNAEHFEKIFSFHSFLIKVCVVQTENSNLIFIINPRIDF